MGLFPRILSFAAEIERVLVKERKAPIAESGPCTDIKRSNRALALLEIRSDLSSSNSESVSSGYGTEIRSTVKQWQPQPLGQAFSWVGSTSSSRSLSGEARGSHFEALPNQPSVHAKQVTWLHCRQGTMTPVTILSQTEHKVRVELLVLDAEQDFEVQCHPIGIPFFSIALNVSPHF